MDILIHTLSGAAVASAFAGLVKENTSSRLKLILLGAFAGALPDVDAISMWSGFDATFRQWFGLEETGREIYRGKHWYSHHAFLHSFLASIFFPGAIMVIYSGIKKRKPTPKMWMHALVFVAAFNAHLIGDLPTPNGSWEGIAFFYPMEQYIGGYGYTWWWNNYDIFILLLTCVMINVLSYFLIRKKNYFGTITLVVTFFLCCIQLGRRDFDFNSKEMNSSVKGDKSLELQRKFLGDAVFDVMVRFDESLPVHF